MKTASFYYKDDHAPKPNKPNHVGTCIFIVAAGKILLEHRADCDLWGLVGGALEIDESFLAGIKREVKEETGLSLQDEQIDFFRLYDDPSRIIAYPDGNVIRSITVSYVAKLDFTPKLTCSDESRELRFFTKDEILSLSVVQTHRHILNDYFAL